MDCVCHSLQSVTQMFPPCRVAHLQLLSTLTHLHLVPSYQSQRSPTPVITHSLHSCRSCQPAHCAACYPARWTDHLPADHLPVALSATLPAQLLANPPPHSDSVRPRASHSSGPPADLSALCRVSTPPGVCGSLRCCLVPDCCLTPPTP